MPNTQNDLDFKMSEKISYSEQLLTEIRDMLHDFPAPETDTLNWGHVGSAGYVVEKLEEIRDFLSNN